MSAQQMTHVDEKLIMDYALSDAYQHTASGMLLLAKELTLASNETQAWLRLWHAGKI